MACEHGFHDTEHYVDIVERTKPELVILAMGMPKQETVALALRAALNEPTTIVNGGAILDFLGGKVARAPEWMRRARIEWVYRLVNEPWRLASRYVVGNPMYVLRVVSTRLPPRADQRVHCRVSAAVRRTNPRGSSCDVITRPL